MAVVPSSQVPAGPESDFDHQLDDTKGGDFGPERNRVQVDAEVGVVSRERKPPFPDQFLGEQSRICDSDRSALSGKVRWVGEQVPGGIFILPWAPVVAEH